MITKCTCTKILSVVFVIQTEIVMDLLYFSYIEPSFTLEPWVPNIWFEWYHYKNKPNILRTRNWGFDVEVPHFVSQSSSIDLVDDCGGLANHLSIITCELQYWHQHSIYTIWNWFWNKAKLPHLIFIRYTPCLFTALFFGGRNSDCG